MPPWQTSAIARKWGVGHINDFGIIVDTLDRPSRKLMEATAPMKERYGPQTGRSVGHIDDCSVASDRLRCRRMAVASDGLYPLTCVGYVDHRGVIGECLGSLSRHMSDTSVRQLCTPKFRMEELYRPQMHEFQSLQNGRGVVNIDDCCERPEPGRKGIPVVQRRSLCFALQWSVR